MSNLLPLLAATVPQLVQYFKEKPVDAVSAGADGSAITLLIVGFMQSRSYDQLITFLQNFGEAGFIASAAMAGLRAALFVYTAAKGK